MPATATPRKPQTLARKLVETRNTSRNRSLADMLGLGESEKELARDFGSGLNDVIGRGTLASLIGLPGDLGGLAENGIRSALGMPQVQPYGGSEHIGQKLEEAGLVSPVRRPKTELLASLISPSQAASAAYRAPQMARAGVRMLDNLAAPRTMGSQTGAIENLWHGSPHTFDRFDLSKIGTGEGAQAYGHGAYLAESPDVAVSYRDALGTKLSHSTGDIRDGVRKAVIDAGGSEDEALLAANEAPFAVSSNDYSRLPEPAAKYLGEIKARQENTGNLYQTRLAWPDPAREATDPLSPDHFLHWDKPLSEQPYAMERLRGSEYLNEQLKAGGFYPSDIDSGLFEGRHLVSAKRTGVADESEAMRQLGIPGIRYLDGGSRGAGDGSHNYVVFDDRLIDIVSRNGQPVGNLGKMVAPQDEALRVAEEAPSIFREGGDRLFGGNADYVARERFNIPALNKISGGGSDRDVYDLGNGYVLKVAKSARGLAQNDASDWYLSNAGILPETVETGENYIVTQKVLPPNPETKRLVNGLKKFSHQDWRNNSDALQQYLEDNNLSDVLNYDVMHGDIAAIRNWGTTADGKPIHLDEGTFNAGILDEFRGKTNMQNPEFAKVYAKSKAAKKKYGDKDKATMYGAGLLAPMLYPSDDK